MFDVLKVQNPNVLNALIDQASVESILLIRSREEASRVIVHERPQGTKAAYTAEGDQVLQYAHYSNRFGKIGILRESVESAVRDEEARLASLRSALEELRGEERSHQRNMEESKRHMMGAMRRIKEKALEKRKVVSAMEELQNAQEEEEPEEDITTYVRVFVPSRGVCLCMCICMYVSVLYSFTRSHVLCMLSALLYIEPVCACSVLCPASVHVGCHQSARSPAINAPHT